MNSRTWAGGLALLLVSSAPVRGITASTPPPSLVVILLDTTRADRFGSLGSGRATTPALDALAADGAQFTRHFANSHATRPSLPQIMSGRYYHPSVLRPFEPDSHPRDYPFLLPDPTARLLTDLLRGAGFHLAGVSAHPWVDPESPMGRSFHQLEYLEAPPKRGHADAVEVVDRAMALWDARPADRPTFLYVHLLDTHTPRKLPEDAPAFLDPAVQWHERFGRNGEPRFGAERRAWEFTDARDFTPADRAVYLAFYDTLLQHADRQVGRLLAHLRADDPTLANTLVVVLADHGEQLGEEGQVKHGDSLIDAVQHTPLILTGAGIAPGQRVTSFSENIDIAPTIASLLEIEPPEGTFEGRALIGGTGRVCPGCPSRPAVYYAWSNYQAVRTKRWLLRVDPSGAPLARCRGGETTLWRLDERGNRTRVEDDRRTRVLREKVGRRLARGAARLDEGLRALPMEPFFVPIEHWRVGDPSGITCVPIDGRIEREALARPGWLLVREGLLITEGPAQPLSVRLTVPDGTYEVAAGVQPLGWLWRVPGLFGRAQEALRAKEAGDFVPLGRATATARALEVGVPPELGQGQRIVNLRLTPIGANAKNAPTIDRQHHERLRTLGYVE